MIEAKLTSRGRVTIPRLVRDRLGLTNGDRIAFVGTDRGFALVRVARGSSALCGMFEGRRASPATLAEIKGAIAEMGGEVEQ